MQKDIRLIINGVQVDLSEDVSIHYTFTEDDLNNPTIIKNSFSKTLVLEGTKTNNDLFSHYWNIERTTGGGFNASKKAPFQLYIGTELYESGYIKLDNVSCISGTYKYNITLYGGLGDFFYSLATNNNTGDKLKLSDLSFDNDFSFTINMDTVKEAWDSLSAGRNNKWQDINFMTAYNGYPDDFDSDKVIINTSGTSLQNKAVDDGKTYTTTQGFVLGQLPEEMTEWEIRDLRSYNQRPVLRLKTLFNACCDPKNNGGYTVIKDPDFFNSENPYWEKTWITLPTIQSFKYNSEEQILSGATLIGEIVTGDTGGMMYQDLDFEIGDWPSTAPSSITVRSKIKAASNYSYFNSSYIWFWNWNGDDYHTGWALFGSLFCQLIALNGDTVVGASNVYNLTSPIYHNGNLYYGHNGRYDGGHKFTPYMDKSITDSIGQFGFDGFKLDGETTPHTFSFVINNLNTPVTGLKMVYYWGASKDKLNIVDGPNRLFLNTYGNGWISRDTPDSNAPVDATGHTVLDIVTDIQAVLGESIGRTGTQVTKNLLLDTDASPCEYMLSYAKMFGLYWLKDIESKTVRVMTRKTFYQRDNIVSLKGLIDYGKDHTITPIIFDSKWFEFSQEKDATQFSESYKTSKGVDYGSKILDTGFDFNSDKKLLLKDNVLKSGIEGLEKSKFYTAYINDNEARPWFGMGLKYNLVNADSNYEITVSARTGDFLSLNEEAGMKYYDMYPKLQFRDKNNDGTDGNNVLVFFSGFKNVLTGRTNPITYMLTDDSVWQTQLNEGKPCWLFTPQEYYGTKRIAYRLNALPVFERYLTKNASGNVWRSLDFGTAQELFIPTYNISDESNIYSNFWKTYLEDLYDVDTKQMVCYIRIIGRPTNDWLRRFYWFDNAIWRINKINDWCVGSEDTTQVTFIKVQDVNNYTSETQGEAAELSLIPQKDNASSAGETITVHINASGLTWRLSNTMGSTLSVYSGTGSGDFTITIPPNTGNEFINWTITASANYQGQLLNARCTIRQDYTGSSSLSATPENIITSYSGGTYPIHFEWYNQGTDNITGYTVGSGAATISATINGNTAMLTIGTNSTSDIIHNTCTFRSRDGKTVVIGIDQLPEVYEIALTGGSKSVLFNYIDGVLVNDKPYWTSVTKAGSYYNINLISGVVQEGMEGDVYFRRSQGTRAGEEQNASVRISTNIAPVSKYLYITPSTITIDDTGGTATFHVHSNVSSEIVVSGSTPTPPTPVTTYTYSIKNVYQGYWSLRTSSGYYTSGSHGPNYTLTFTADTPTVTITELKFIPQIREGKTATWDFGSGIQGSHTFASGEYEYTVPLDSTAVWGHNTIGKIEDVFH